MLRGFPNHRDVSASPSRVGMTTKHTKDAKRTLASLARVFLGKQATEGTPINGLPSSITLSPHLASLSVSPLPPFIWRVANIYGHDIVEYYSPRHLSPSGFGSTTAARSTEWHISLNTVLSTARQMDVIAGSVLKHETPHNPKAAGFGVGFLRLCTWCLVSISSNPGSDGLVAG